MPKKENKQNEDLTSLLSYLKRIHQVFEEDRKRAIEFRDMLVVQLKTFHDDDMAMTEDARLEKAINDAEKNINETSKKLDLIIKSITQVLITNLNNTTRENIASEFFGEDGKVLVGNDIDMLKYITKGSKIKEN